VYTTWTCFPWRVGGSLLHPHVRQPLVNAGLFVVLDQMDHFDSEAQQIEDIDQFNGVDSCDVGRSAVNVISA